jgi:hypothetical protein
MQLFVVFLSNNKIKIMKKLILPIIGILFTLQIFAQGKVVWKDLNLNPIDTVTVNCELGGEPAALDVFISNVSSSSQNVILKRVIVSYISGAADLLCYGTSCRMGDENTAEIVTGASSQAAGANAHTNTWIHYDSKGHLGTTVLKYYICLGYNDDNGNGVITSIEDSLVVIYKKDFGQIKFVVDMSACPGFDETGDVTVTGDFGNDIVMEHYGSSTTKFKAYAEVDTGKVYHYNYKWNNKTSGNYTVQVGSVDIKTNDSWLVGVANNIFNEVKVYPVPFVNSLTITNLENASKVEMTNVLGQSVYSTTSLNSTLYLNVDGLNTGIYFLRITDKNDNIYTKRVVKK